MTTEAKPKSQLHQSNLNMLYRCGEQFRRVVVEGEHEPPGFAALVGSNVHDVARINLTHKAQTEGQLLPIEAVLDYARDGFVALWTSRPVVLTKEEREKGLDAIKGLGIDRSVILARAHAERLAPMIDPAPDGIEKKWVLEAKGYPFDLAGQIDVETKDGDIRDLKTGARALRQTDADTSEQLTMYAFAAYILKNRIPTNVWLDTVSVSKAGEAAVTSLPSTRTMFDFACAKARFERACQVIEREAYTPTSRSNWWCSEKFCGFAADGSCKFFNKCQKSFSVSQPTNTGATHGPKKGINVIAAGTPEWLDATR